MCARRIRFDLDLHVAVLGEHKRRVLTRHDLKAIGVAHRVCHSGHIQKEYCGDGEDFHFYLLKRFVLYHILVAPGTGAAKMFANVSPAAVEGCRDLAETAAALDRLIDSAERFGWSIAPAWWRKVPQKNTAYFINRLKVNAEDRNASLRENPRA